ncbi:Peptidase M14 [Rhodovastum atsumiense]|uniref:Peptidase M14 n=1 Tax=Rhodovastum atsumiense TaxID=504468 RepID=A0A5M6ISJ0_9PROT|nr:succinylglutamate desuccinylase/aspartoacylase family protein [Rhodovastum atsumiense]KAA5611273.1 peptidase M14 [Rhodovastum atsumiense]CAH2601737.1 Peptidase M14 [Rhodovastum atsumiense]
METLTPTPMPLPHFDVRLRAPDLSPWEAGNTGVPGFVSHAAEAPGPHVMVLALTHGNEIAGAIVLDRLLRAALRPARGRLTCGFVNLAAFHRFIPEQPTGSRFIDEDLNRLWDEDLLESGRRSAELDRAREIRPMIDAADILLDLHSMLWPSDPLILSGPTARGRALARDIGTPALVVADEGHVTGRRIIDYARFTAPAAEATAVLVEAGQHWEPDTVTAMEASVAGLLRHAGLVDAHPALPPAGPVPPQRMAEVTMTVTAATAGFAFVQPWRGGQVIERGNTLIALDGTREIRTPHDDCMLVMPSLRASRGHTAVRLARFLDA